MTNKLELKHVHHCIDGNWYWICPVCGEWLCPHEAGRGKGHLVLISKGHATKHLMSHNMGYVPKGKSIAEIISKKLYFCNRCNDSVMSKTLSKQIYKDVSNFEPKHKFLCLTCYYNNEQGLKTKDQVHKGIK